MGNTYEKLKEEFAKKVRELQKKCKHEKRSGWVPQMWAPGHFTGTEVKVCKTCGAVVDQR